MTRPEGRRAAAPFTVRPGTADDTGVVLGLFDSAVRWMVARGTVEQWGSEPFSGDPARVSAVAGWAAGGGLRICEREQRPVAALAVGAAPSYVPPPAEPELYVVALVSDLTAQARGAGRVLLDEAEREARERGVGLLRVDCFAGNDEALVRYYESAGFTRTSTFAVGSWPGQVLARRLPPAQTGAR